MGTRKLDVVEDYRSRVDELSALATRGQTVGAAGELLAIGDEATTLFALRMAAGGPPDPEPWDTGYAPPPHSGSNFEGLAGDATGQILIVTELPAGVVIVDEAARAGRRFTSYTRVRFDEDSMRGLAGMGDDELQPEGALLLRNGHLLVTHEKRPAGLFELGPPGDEPLGIHPDAYLPHGARFAAPPQLVAKAWWPVTGSGSEDRDLGDVSDLALSDGRLYLLSDQSRCLARVADGTLGPHDDLAIDRVWKLPGGDRKAEGLIFRDDGTCYIGFDVKLRDEPHTPNLLLGALT